MTARIAGFVSRADAGLRSPRSRSTRISPSRGGVACHYGGDGGVPSTHAGCVGRWRGWQAYHMDGHKWADIAYSFGYCQHGYVFAGRGFGVRTAANGTNAGNDSYYAACWLGGSTAEPSREALDALEWIVAEARKSGGAGDAVRAHRWFKSTSCPGGVLARYAEYLHGRVLSDARPVPEPELPPDEESDELNADQAAALARIDRSIQEVRDRQRVHHAILSTLNAVLPSLVESGPWDEDEVEQVKADLARISETLTYDDEKDKGSDVFGEGFGS